MGHKIQSLAQLHQDLLFQREAALLLGLTSALHSAWSVCLEASGRDGKDRLPLHLVQAHREAGIYLIATLMWFPNQGWFCPQETFHSICGHL